MVGGFSLSLLLKLTLFHLIWVGSVTGQFVPQPCVTNLTLVVQSEMEVVDTSIRREYVLCPNTIFETGLLDTVSGQIVGMFPLVVRANATVKCGDDGSRSNNCTIASGDLGLTLQPFSVPGSEPIDGAIIMGVQISDILLQPVSVFDVHGTVQFVDCAFLVSDSLKSHAAMAQRNTS